MVTRDSIRSALTARIWRTSAAAASYRELTVDFVHRPSFASVLTGVRRAGKSTLLKTIGFDTSGAIFADFEDPRFFGMTREHVPWFIESCQQLKAKTLLLDEVQIVDDWPLFVRAALDAGLRVFVTGSNASLLRSDVGAKLTGRHLQTEVFPFSFEEYCTYRKQAPSSDAFARYLDEGGFPGYLRERDPVILRELLRDLITRDIAERYQIRQTRHLMNLALQLYANTGQPLSLQSLHRTLDIPTVGQVGRYLEYLEDAYVLLSLPKFDTAFKKRVVAPRKYYAIDTGMRQANAGHTQPDVGRRAENAVFVALRSQTRELSYATAKDLWECDFVTPHAAIQVCWVATQDNLLREIKGLVSFSRTAPRSSYLILTSDQTDTFREHGITIQMMPIWKWLHQEGHRAAAGRKLHKKPAKKLR